MKPNLTFWMNDLCFDTKLNTLNTKSRFIARFLVFLKVSKIMRCLNFFLKLNKIYKIKLRNIYLLQKIFKIPSLFNVLSYLLSIIFQLIVDYRYFFEAGSFHWLNFYQNVASSGTLTNTEIVVSSFYCVVIFA